MVITDQVATAPCTDRVQVRSRTFEAKPPIDRIALAAALWLRVATALHQSKALENDNS